MPLQKSFNLDAFLAKPVVEPIPQNWNGPYIQGDRPKDGWGNEFHYTSSGKGYEIWSYGADEKLGGEGDDADIYSSQL